MQRKIKELRDQRLNNKNRAGQQTHQEEDFFDLLDGGTFITDPQLIQMQYELQRRQKEEFSGNEGLFLKKNQTIAPYFREFLMNKRRKQKNDNMIRHQRAAE